MAFAANERHKQTETSIFNRLVEIWNAFCSYMSQKIKFDLVFYFRTKLIYSQKRIMFSPICSQFTIQRGAVVIGKMGNKNWKKATTACDPAVADKHNNWYIFSPVLCDLYWVSTSKSEYYAILKKLFMVNNEILFRSNDRMRKETTLFLYHLVSTAASKTTEMRTKPHLFYTRNNNNKQQKFI